MNDKRIQVRGNCPCCGRDQAVVKGTMSKHGYTVEQGWFQGVCSGDRYAPMQVQREVTDRIVAQVRKDVAELMEKVEQLKAGKIHPTHCKTSSRPKAEPVAWADAPEWARNDAVRTAIYQTEGRARAGTSFADQMEALLNAVHGQPLREVTVESGPAPIQIGERRMSERGVLTVVSVQGARVYWKDERGFKSWTGSSAWRKLQIAD